MTPYHKAEPTLISFSGGRTSGMMLYRAIQAHGGELPPNYAVVFANTGLEHPATLEFIYEVECRWGVEVAWVEFDKDAEHLTRVVDYFTASRDGRPLREVIETRPTQHLFNPVSRYCTATSKQRRMFKYLRHWLGWDRWHCMVGMRADEMRRVSRLSNRDGNDRSITNFAPLAEQGVTKEDVAEFWNKQNFDLNLPNIGGVTPLGNCVLCPLKAKGKLVNVLRVDPGAADWWVEQERNIESRLRAQGVADLKMRCRFHKDGTSYADLLDQAALANILDEPMDEGYAPAIDCFCTD